MTLAADFGVATTVAAVFPLAALFTFAAELEAFAFLRLRAEAANFMDWARRADFTELADFFAELAERGVRPLATEPLFLADALRLLFAPLLLIALTVMSTLAVLTLSVFSVLT